MLLAHSNANHMTSLILVNTSTVGLDPIACRTYHKTGMVVTVICDHYVLLSLLCWYQLSMCAASTAMLTVCHLHVHCHAGISYSIASSSYCHKIPNDIVYRSRNYTGY